LDQGEILGLLGPNGSGKSTDMTMIVGILRPDYGSVHVLGVVEFLRSLTNRISSSFYEKTGRSGIFLRLVLTIFLLVSFQLLFSGRIIIYLLETVMEAV